MPGLTNSSGQVVNAVYGFFSMLLTVLTEQKPTHLVICFDRTQAYGQTEYVCGLSRTSTQNGK